MHWILSTRRSMGMDWVLSRTILVLEVIQTSLCSTLLVTMKSKISTLEDKQSVFKISWALHFVITTGWYCISGLIIGLFVMAWLPATAQASLHTISLWFIWTLNLASLQTTIGPLGWDNWFCISHWEGWNNIQDGWDDRDLANLPAATHFDLCRLLSASQSARQFIRVWLLPYIHPFLKSADSEWVRARRCHCEHPPKSWTRSSRLREHHAPLCLLWQTLPPLRKYHFVIQHTHSTFSFILHGAQSLSLSYSFIYS